MTNLFIKLKRVVAGVSIATLLLAPAFPLVAQADTPTSPNDPLYYGTNTSGTPLNPASQQQAWGGGNPIGAGQVNSTDEIGCGIANGTKFAICLTNIVYVFTVGIGSGFAYVSAYFFDWAVALSLNSLAYSQQFVSQMWTTARDLANMAFLFIILYIAFNIMLDSETSSMLQTLLRVIVIALIINFSFFFVRVVIDAGNIVAIQFYNAITADSISTTAGKQGITGSVATALNTATSAVGATGAGNTKDLTASIMGMLQLQNLFNTSSFTNFYSSNPGFMVTAIALTFLYIAAGIMFWILTVTFAVAGIKFIGRVIALWFAIIASPLALIAWATPHGRKWFDKWLDMLVQNAIYPVVFMFVFLMLTIFAKQMGQTNGLIYGIFSGLSGNATSDNVLAAIGLAAANVGIRLGLVVGVLWVGLKAANSMETLGSHTAQSFGSWVGGYFGRTMAGAPAWVGRQTLGRVGNVIAESPSGRVGATQSGLTGSLWRGAGRLGNATYDVRNAPGAGAAGKVAKGQGLIDDTGKPAAGYTQQQKDAREKEEKKMKERDSQLEYVKNRQDTKKLGAIEATWAEDEKKLKELEAQEKSTASLTTAPGSPGVVALPPDDMKELTRLRNLRGEREQLISNTQQIEPSKILELKAKDIEGIIQHVTDKQMKAIDSSARFSSHERTDLNHLWHEKSKKAPLAESKEQIQKLSEMHDELTKLNVNIKELGAYSTASPTSPVTVNLGSTKSLKKVLEGEKDRLEDVRDDRRLDDTPVGKAKRTEAGQAAKKLTKAIERITKLEEQVKQIPEGVGGAKNEGEFFYTGKGK